MPCMLSEKNLTHHLRVGPHRTNPAYRAIRQLGMRGPFTRRAVIEFAPVLTVTQVDKAFQSMIHAEELIRLDEHRYGSRFRLRGEV